MLRAVQTFTTLVSSLGLYAKVMPDTLHQANQYIRENYPDVVNDSKEAMDIGSALETISNWLERVADRDPMLFRQLSETINSKSAKDVQLNKEEVNANA